jgi:predicted transcriptional regulator
MDTHNFMLILDGPIDEATSDLLFEVGLDDAAVTAFAGHPALDVDREAPTLLDAITSAVTQVESVADIHVVRVEGEELVSQADIAERTGRSRQAVNHWIRRDAESSGFPAPAYGTSTRSPLWRWTDVQAWLEPDGHSGDRGRIIALVNATLLARHNLHDDDEGRLVRTLLAAG